MMEIWLRIDCLWECWMDVLGVVSERVGKKNRRRKGIVRSRIVVVLVNWF